MIKKIYKLHHKKYNRYGTWYLKEERGKYLRDNIGVDKKVLDLGCRDGELTSTYCEGNNVLGIDVDNISLKIIKKNLNIRTQCLNIYNDWNFKEKFDVVVAGELLEHLYYPKEILKKPLEILDEVKQENDNAKRGKLFQKFVATSFKRLGFFPRTKNSPHEKKSRLSTCIFKGVTTKN